MAEVARAIGELTVGEGGACRLLCLVDREEAQTLRLEVIGPEGLSLDSRLAAGAEGILTLSRDGLMRVPVVIEDTRAFPWLYVRRSGPAMPAERAPLTCADFVFPVRFRVLDHKHLAEVRQRFRERFDMQLGWPRLAEASQAYSGSERQQQELILLALAKMLVAVDRKLDGLRLALRTGGGGDLADEHEGWGVELGGDGLVFVTGARPEPESYLEIELRLPLVPLLVPLPVFARVLEVQDRPGEPECRRVLVRTEFVALHEEDRDIVMQYVFRKQREELRRRRRSAGPG